MDKLQADAFVVLKRYDTVVCEKTWRWEDTLTDYDLWYVTGGKGGICINHTDYELSPGCCYLLCPGDTVRAWHDKDDPVTVTYLHFLVNGTPHHLPAGENFRLPTSRFSGY